MEHVELRLQLRAGDLSVSELAWAFGDVPNVTPKAAGCPCHTDSQSGLMCTPNEKRRSQIVAQPVIRVLLSPL